MGCSSEHVKFGNLEYRTAGSSRGLIGSWGDKLLDGPTSYGLQQDRPNWEDIRVAVLTTEKHCRTSIRKLALSGLNYKRLADLGFDMERKLKEGFLVTTFSIINMDDLVTLINADKDLRAKLRMDERTRIIIGNAKIYDQEFESKVKGKFHAEMSLGEIWGGKDVQFKFEGGVTATKNISDGTIIGYQFARICWTADGTVAKLVEDRPILFWRTDRGQCPANTTVKVGRFQ